MMIFTTPSRGESYKWERVGSYRFKPLKDVVVLELPNYHHDVIIQRDLCEQYIDKNAGVSNTMYKLLPEGLDMAKLAYIWKFIVQLQATRLYTYARICEHGYECSSRGDIRFSAFGAYLPDGDNIETKYQLDVKGYRKYGNNWKLGKGKPPLEPITVEALFQKYKDLWKEYFLHEPYLFEELQKILSSQNIRTLTDMFAWTPINQARAIACIINDCTFFDSP